MATLISPEFVQAIDSLAEWRRTEQVGGEEVEACEIAVAYAQGKLATVKLQLKEIAARRADAQKIVDEWVDDLTDPIEVLVLTDEARNT